MYYGSVFQCMCGLYFSLKTIFKGLNGIVTILLGVFDAIIKHNYPLALIVILSMVLFIKKIEEM